MLIILSVIIYLMLMIVFGLIYVLIQTGLFYHEDISDNYFEKGITFKKFKDSIEINKKIICGNTYPIPRGKYKFIDMKKCLFIMKEEVNYPFFSFNPFKHSIALRGIIQFSDNSAFITFKPPLAMYFFFFIYILLISLPVLVFFKFSIVNILTIVSILELTYTLLYLIKIKKEEKTFLHVYNELKSDIEEKPL